MTLSDIKDGSSFRIVKLRAQGEIRRRLIDMGFIRGAQGSVLREGLFRDPIELQLKGFKVSVRRDEAKQILVEEIEERRL